MTENFLRKIKLIQPISLEIPLSQAVFKDKLYEAVSEKKYNLFEQFSNNGKLFVGDITGDEFNIRPIKKLFQSNLSYLTRFKGNYQMSGSGKTIVQGEISISKFYPVLMLVFMIISYGFTVAIAFTAWIDLTPLIFVFGHGLIMLVVFYFVFRRCVNQGKHYMERELFFLTKENN